MTSKIIPDRVGLRALNAFVLDPDTFCHISTYSVANHGYSQIGWQIGDGTRKTDGTTAHRAAWTAVHGQIPEGLTIDHVCRNKVCVNVRHLRLLTNEQNGRGTYGVAYEGDDCRNGHPASERRLFSRGSRKGTRCGKCYAEVQKRSRAKRKATRNDPPKV